jgi:signal transduction histidine kinase
MGAVDGARLLRETAEGWRPRLEREGFELAVETTELPLRADAEALRRALDNLVDNARKYSGEDRRIELGGTIRDGEAWLTVRDHGPGIPVGERSRVLQPFHRLESADRKETAGTGLGLSLVVATMEAHGGRVEIESGGDQGACVSLVLPLESES